MSEERINHIRDRAAIYEKRHVHRAFYVEPDHGDTYCRQCLNRLIKEGQVQECWPDDPSKDCDTYPRCDAPVGDLVCGRTLDGLLTHYGAMDELETFEEHGFNIRNHEHCYIWALCENAFATDSPEMERLIAVAGQKHPRKQVEGVTG